MGPSSEVSASSTGGLRGRRSRRLTFIVSAWVAMSVFGTPAGAGSAGREPSWVTPLPESPPGLTIVGAGDVLLDPGGSRLYVTGYASEGEGSTRSATFVAAVEAASGRRVWQVWNRAYDSRPFGISPSGRHLYLSGQEDGGPGWLSAMRTSTGTTAWSVRIAGSFHVAAVGPDGTLFVAAGIRGRDTDRWRTVVSARDPSDGMELWRSVVGRELPSFSPDDVEVSPDGTRVLLGGEAGPFGDAICPRGVTAALSAGNGAIRWLEVGRLLPGCGFVDVVSDADGLVLTLREVWIRREDGHEHEATGIEARRVSDGSIVWRRLLWFFQTARAVVDPSGSVLALTGLGDRVNEGRLFTLSTDSGAVLWRRQLGTDPHALSFGADRRLYVAGTAYGPELASTRAVVLSLAGRDGGIRWKGSYRAEGLPNALWADVIGSVDGRHIFVVGEADNGSPGWTAGTDTEALVASYRT